MCQRLFNFQNQNVRLGDNTGQMFAAGWVQAGPGAAKLFSYF